VVGRCVVGRGRARPRTGAALGALNELSRTIVAAVADHHEVLGSDDELEFVASKAARG
jgi:hypothetical protein